MYGVTECGRTVACVRMVQQLERKIYNKYKAGTKYACYNGHSFRRVISLTKRKNSKFHL